tara:strand:+ start:6221 stop:6346 length:126 start_codon:yes stop_codon:yes gene_type:complete
MKQDKFYPGDTITWEVKTKKGKKSIKIKTKVSYKKQKTKKL